MRSATKESMGGSGDEKLSGRIDTHVLSTFFLDH
jgi:hypothetical protein